MIRPYGFLYLCVVCRNVVGFVNDLGYCTYHNGCMPETKEMKE